MMKRVIVVTLLLAGAMWARSQAPPPAETCKPGNGVTCTPNLNLWIPPMGLPNWQIPMNSNFMIMDSLSSVPLDPRNVTYGALCDWNGTTGTDDTKAFQAAAVTANAMYLATGATVGVRVPGTCVVNGTVTYGSGVHWVGPGTIIVQDQSKPTPHYTLLAQNADNVSIENVTINVITPCPGNNATCSAIAWLDTSTDTAPHGHVNFRHNTISNSNWGIVVGYFQGGSGSLSNVSVTDNDVTSPAGSYSNADGIHVAGRVSGITMNSNRVMWRSDACLSVTSENGNYVLSGATINNNTCLQDRVGIDVSGGTNVQISGNIIKSTLANAGTSNPAFRQIFYGGTFPINIHTFGNYFENNATGSPDWITAKLDESNYSGPTTWPPLNSTFEGNTLGGNPGAFYARGNTISVNNNTFLTPGTFIELDYDSADNMSTTNVAVGTNTWMQSGALRLGAGCGFYSNISVAPQNPAQGATITYDYLDCAGTQTFSVPGTLVTGSDLTIGGSPTGTLRAAPGSYISYVPGAGTQYDFAWRDPTNTSNHMVLDDQGNLIVTGMLTVDGYVHISGYGIENPFGTVIIPGAVNGYTGPANGYVVFANSTTMTPGHCVVVGPFGGVADAGAPCTLAAAAATAPVTTGSIGGSAMRAGDCATGTATLSSSGTGHAGVAAAADGSAIPAGFVVNPVTVNGTTATVSICAIAAGTLPAKTYNVTVLR